MPEPELGLGLEMPDRSAGRLTMMMKSRSERTVRGGASKNSFKCWPFGEGKSAQFLLTTTMTAELVSRQAGPRR